MGILILVIILAVCIYAYSFNNRDRTLDYKLQPSYQHLSNADKMLFDIINGLENAIKMYILDNMDNNYARIIAIEALIQKRELTFYQNVTLLSNEHKITISTAKYVIHTGCNTVRLKYNLPIGREY